MSVAYSDPPSSVATTPLCVSAENLVKIYKVDDLEVMALQGLDLEVATGEMLAIVGASGSGKSTLLNILGGLDAPSAGKCVVAGRDLTRLRDGQRTTYRCDVVGHVWQQSGRNLLPTLTIGENVDLVQAFGGMSPRRRRQRSRELLGQVGLGDMLHKKPDELSGGEQQRAAIAVALANDPPLLLADEPTGELDSETADTIFALLRRLNQETGLTIITVTHDAALAAASDRTVAIRDGRTSTETVRRDAPLTTNNGLPAAASAIIGLPGETHRESIVIDRVGRLQLPKDAIEQLPFRGRAEVRITGDHVELWPLSNGDIKE